MISRREALLAGGAAALLKGAQPSRTPNVLLMLVDDLGYADISCYGQKHFRTPNIDSLATTGTRFTDAYAGSPVCAPARCTLMTGLHTGHCRVRNNFTEKGERYPLQSGDFTMAELFQQAGYRTGLVGKWGLGEPDTEGIPNRKGFDYFYGFLNQKHAHDHYPDYLWRNTERVELGKKHYAQDLFTEEAARFIDSSSDKPWFLDLSWTLPHALMQIPEADLARVRGKLSRTGGDEEIAAAMITKIDRDVGRLLALLRDKGLERDTIVIFASDNGAPNDGRDTKYLGSCGPLRGHKGEVYEGGIRVPFLVQWPGHTPAGRTSAEPFAFFDLLPTFADMLDRPLPSRVDGVSMLPAFEGKQQPERKRPLYWELRHRKIGQQAVRDGKWKAVRLGKDAPVELYDLATDIGEKTNLAASQKAIAARLGAVIDAEHVDAPEYPLHI